MGVLHRLVPVPAPTPPRQGWGRPDARIAGGLFLANLLVRLPFLSRYLNTWDSVLFALSLSRYSVPDARPHPPGYPVYIAMAKLLRPFFPDENATLVALSVLLTAGCAVLVYRLARLVGSRRAAVAASVLFSLSPILLYNSVIATSYPGEAFFMVLVALVAWRAWQAPTTRNAAILGGTFALALGFRQSFLFYLSPLVAWALLAPRVGARRAMRNLARAAAAAVGVGLVWAIPMIVLSGGLAEYLKATSLQTSLVVFAQTVFNAGRPAWDDHLTRFLLFLDTEKRLVLPVLVVLLVVGAIASRRAATWRSALGWPQGFGRFLALWTLPAILFYLLIFDGWNVGPNGYILILLPAAYCVFAWLADAALALLRDVQAGPPWHRWLALASPILLLSPAPALAAEWSPMYTKEVKDHDAWTDSWLGLSTRFPPNETAIVASYSWAHVKWFFPDYIEWSYLAIPAQAGQPAWVLTIQSRHHEDDISFYHAHEQGPTGATHPIPPGIRHLVLFDFQLAGENGGTNALAANLTVHEGHLADGWRILYVDTDAAHPTIESYFRDQPNQPLP